MPREIGLICRRVAVGSLAAVLLVLGQVSPSQAVLPLTVCASGCDYSTIQAALNAAASGGTIEVRAGTYAEAISITKPVTLLGAQTGVHPSASGRAGGESTMTNKYPVSIASGGVTISGFEFSGFRHALYVPASAFPLETTEVSGITVSDNWLHSTAADTGKTAFTAEPGRLSDLAITGNLFSLGGDFLACIGFSSGNWPNTVRYSNLTITNNEFAEDPVSLGGYGIFAGADPAKFVINTMAVTDNLFHMGSSSVAFNAGNISNGTFTGNVVATAGGSLGIDTGTVSGNSFITGGRFGLYGSVFGFTRPSKNLTIANNLFNNNVNGRGLTLDPYANNTAGVAAGLAPGDDPPVAPAVTAASLTLHSNAFYSSTSGNLIRNLGVGTLTSTDDWWGTGTGPSGLAACLATPSTSCAFLGNPGSIAIPTWLTVYVPDSATQVAPTSWPLSQAGLTAAPGFWPASTPSAPEITTITPGGGQLSVAFSAPSDNGGDAVSNYEYSTDNGATWTTRSPVSTASPLVITGLGVGTSYQVKVRAVNGVGYGAASTAVSAATAATQTITFPAPATLDVGDTFVPMATATSGLPVTVVVDGTATVCAMQPDGGVHILTTGTCTLTATQAGDSSYLAATPVTVNITTVSGDGIASTTVVAPAGSTAAAVDDPVLGSPSISFGAPSEGTVSVTVEPVAVTTTVLKTPFRLTGATVIDITVAGATGPFTVCLAGEPPAHLWHYNGTVWVDITGVVLDAGGNPVPGGELPEVTGKICGMTATLSPVAVADVRTCTPAKIGTVRFRGDSARLTTVAKWQLRYYAYVVRDTTCTVLVVDGYSAKSPTDGSWVHAQRISRARALATAEFLNSRLKSLGVTVTVRTFAHGRNDPVASNKTAAGRAKNRRAVISVMDS